MPSRTADMTAATATEVKTRLPMMAPAGTGVARRCFRDPRVGDGIEATRLLREHDAGIKVLVLTTYADDRSVIDALRAGAGGYLTKDAGAAEIRAALERVISGQPAIEIGRA